MLKSQRCNLTCEWIFGLHMHEWVKMKLHWLLYNWYFLQAFNFCYFHVPNDNAKNNIFQEDIQ